MKSAAETCRLCLRSSLRGRKIAITNEDFQQKMKIVFPFHISLTESLPAHACRGCRETVEQFYEYSEKVRSNQANLEAGLSSGIDADGNDARNLVKVEAPAKVDTNSKEITIVIENDSELLAQERDSFHVEQLKIEPVLYGEQSVTEHHELIEEHLSERLVKIESHDNFMYEEEEDMLEELPTVPDGDTSTERTENRTESPQSRKKRKNKPRAEDEQLLRKHFDLRCEKCPHKSESIKDLFQHYRQQHQTPGYVECCNRKFIRRARLLEHLKAHLGSIVCDICGKVFRNVFSLNLHKLDHEKPRSARQHKCDVCNLSFHKLYHLKQHQKRHERVRCTICDRMLAGEQGLKIHMHKVHGTDNKQICPTCGKEFRCELAMKRHMNSHLGIVTVERVQCDQCAKWFDSKLNLRHHVKGVHDGSGPVQCDECPHISPNRRALMSHKLRAHVRKQTYECEHCGKKLNTKLTLREHMATHTNIPLYSCEFCGITFNSNANKYVHRKSKHPQEWEALMQQKLQERMGTDVKVS